MKPGEFWFDEEEHRFKNSFIPDFIVIEPNLPWQKSVWPNKDWGQENYESVALVLSKLGYKIIQFRHNNTRRILNAATLVDAGTFRKAIAALSCAKLYIGPEGGMHHASAAVGVHAVVLFGGFIPPEVVGYDGQFNLTGGAEACGNIQPCAHCREAMDRIKVKDVIEAASWYLK